MSESFKEKTKQTLKNRYGVEHNFQIKEVLESRKQTWKDKYGLDHPMKDSSVELKRQQTSLIKYGTSNPASSALIKEKISSKVSSIECQEKTKETNLKKYGVERYTNINQILETHYTKISRIEQFYNCTSLIKILSEFGFGLYLRNDFPILIVNGYKFVRNIDIPYMRLYSKFKRYNKEHENAIEKLLNKYNLEYKKNDRSLIKPLEIDFYIPSLNLAIEFNGTYWHSNKEPNYHLNKSLLCREKQIRLIHIYEFENFSIQLNLLENLILGNDLYYKEDFNKNNLIEFIPELVLVYNESNYKIYGAGKLYCEGES